MASGVHTFEGTIELVTGAAIRFQGVYWEGALWFPLSQIEIVPDNDDTGAVVIHVKDWLARKRQLLEFTHYGAEEIEAMNSQ